MLHFMYHESLQMHSEKMSFHTTFRCILPLPCPERRDWKHLSFPDWRRGQEMTSFLSTTSYGRKEGSARLLLPIPFQLNNFIFSHHFKLEDRELAKQILILLPTILFWEKCQVLSNVTSFTRLQAATALGPGALLHLHMQSKGRGIWGLLGIPPHSTLPVCWQGNASLSAEVLDVHRTNPILSPQKSGWGRLVFTYVNNILCIDETSVVKISILKVHHPENGTLSFSTRQERWGLRREVGLSHQLCCSPNSLPTGAQTVGANLSIPFWLFNSPRS